MQHHPVVQECFHAILRLREGGHDPRCADDVHALLCQALARMLQDPHGLHLPAGDARHIGFALAALADEVAMRAPGDVPALWQTRKLQALFFDEHLAGDHFYDRLNELQASGDGHEAALCANYMALALGFEGRLGGEAGLEARRALMMQLQRRLQGSGQEADAPLSPYPLAQREAAPAAGAGRVGRAAYVALALWAALAWAFGLAAHQTAQSRVAQAIDIANTRWVQAGAQAPRGEAP